ncbi:RNase P modulator RnpM [Chloroflexota bacterium]
MRSISPHPAKHIPQRTCVACRQVKAKHELVRLVRISDSNVEIDTSSKKAGRGAYLCRIQECWDTGLKSGRLEHTLRITLTQDNRERLIESGKALLTGLTDR